MLIYREEDLKYFGGIGDLTAGAYVINRIQKETESNVWIADVYLKAAIRGWYFEFEGLTIQGATERLHCRVRMTLLVATPIQKGQHLGILHPVGVHPAGLGSHAGAWICQWR